MWDYIHNLPFVSVNGPLDPPGRTFEEITSVGRDGVAFRQVGKRGQDTTLIAARDYVDGAAADLALETYKQLLGRVVTITQYGAVRGNYMIMGVREIAESRVTVAKAVGGILQGLGLHWMATEWQVIYVAPEVEP